MFHFLPARHPANLSALSRKHIPYKFSKPNRQINTAEPNIVRISRARHPLNESNRFSENDKNDILRIKRQKQGLMTRLPFCQKST